MTILNRHTDLDAFFSRLRGSADGLLMLDYDGTLAPFTTQRDRAIPYPDLRPILQGLAAGKRCRTVIVSGRSAAELPPLLQLDPLPEIWGSHGWERLLPDGRYIPPPLDRQAAHVLAEEWSWLNTLFPPERLEHKPASVALHWRGLEHEIQMTLRGLASKRWTHLHARAAVEIHGFDGGMELRARGRTKADAVVALLNEYTAQPVAAYLGDDHTDEDAFTALEDRGLRVLVRKELRPTAADVHLVPPVELIDFLEQWISHLS